MLVNSRSNKLVNIASTKMMKGIAAGMQKRHPHRFGFPAVSLTPGW
jgi:hypothetical protein